MDSSALIRADHLSAALAVWDYCDASAAYIFGDAIGDEVADRILAELRSAGTELSQDDLVNLFGRHKGRERLSSALATLKAAGRITQRSQATAGRPATLYALVAS